MSETDAAALAVAQVFVVCDSEWSDRLVELLREADLDDFRVKLLAEHKRRLDEFYLRFPGERERSERERTERKTSIAAEDLNASNDE